MEKYLYKIFIYDNIYSELTPYKLEDFLNNKYKEGWELVCQIYPNIDIHSTSPFVDTTYFFSFRKKIIIEKEMGL